MYLEIIDSLIESYEEDEEDTLIECLIYLYNNTTDKKLQREAKSLCEEKNRCIHCGGKLVTEEWTESHNELDFPCEEHFYKTVCNDCGREV